MGDRFRWNSGGAIGRETENGEPSGGAVALLYRCALHLDFVKARGTGAKESRWLAAKAIRGKVRSRGIWQIAGINTKLLQRGKRMQ